MNGESKYSSGEWAGGGKKKQKRKWMDKLLTEYIGGEFTESYVTTTFLLTVVEHKRHEKIGVECYGTHDSKAQNP